MGTTQMAGKVAELYVFNELLKRGAVPYLPLVDEGVDALMRTPTNQVIELQIRSKSDDPKYPHRFQMKNVEPRKRFFIVCVEVTDSKPGDVWIIPSAVFDKYANLPPNGSSPRNLDLDKGVKRHGMALRDLLCGFRNRWELLLDYEKYELLMERIEDLEDILTMKEASEAPGNEAVSLEEYERSRKTNLRD